MSRTAQSTRRPSQLPPRAEARAPGADPREPSFGTAEQLFLKRLEELYAASFRAWEDFEPETS
jgi:hypothetical protein